MSQRKLQAFAYHVLSRHFISWDHVTHVFTPQPPFSASVMQRLFTRCFPGLSEQMGLGSLLKWDHTFPLLHVFVTQHFHVATAPVVCCSFIRSYEAGRGSSQPAVSRCA